MDPRHDTRFAHPLALGGPYRSVGAPSPREAEDDHAAVDSDLTALLIAFWLVSVVRVVGAVVRNETFFAEASLALIVVVSLPWLLQDALRAQGRRLVRRGRTRTSGRRGARA